VPFEVVIEVAVRVRPVEQPPGDVVDAQVQPGPGAAGPEALARGGESVVRHLPVDEQAIGVDHHGGDPVLPVAPGDVLGKRFGLLARAEIELLGERCAAVDRHHGAAAVAVAQDDGPAHGIEGDLDARRELVFPELGDPGQSQALRAVDELLLRRAPEQVARRARRLERARILAHQRQDLGYEIALGSRLGWHVGSKRGRA